MRRGSRTSDLADLQPQAASLQLREAGDLGSPLCHADYLSPPGNLADRVTRNAGSLQGVTSTMTRGFPDPVRLRAQAEA